MMNVHISFEFSNKEINKSLGASLYGIPVEPWKTYWMIKKYPNDYILDIAGRRHVSPRTIKKHLDKLADCGLLINKYPYVTGKVKLI